jgi:predicted porin
MKKSLIALAALAAVTAASAQSSVTISGLVRAGFQKDLTNTAANPTTVVNTAAAPAAAAAAVVTGTGLSTHDININFAAVEDLGGGLKASFFQNFDTNPQRTAHLARGDSGLDLSGGFGTLSYRNTRQSDQIASIGSSAVILPDGLYNNTGIVTRADIDVLTYTSPAIMPGLNASVSYIEGNNGQISLAATNKTSVVLGTSYTNGPLAVRGTYKMKPATTTASSGLTPKANLELAAVYDFGVARVGIAYDAASASGASTAAAASATAATANNTLTAAQTQTVANLQTKSATGLSLHVPIGAVSLGLGYYTRGDMTVTEFGIRYDLSKRTYASATTGKKDGLFNAEGYGGSQYRIAMSHTF